jgi:hypothetical protein
MDCCDNTTTLNTEEQEDEPFYCSPAYAKEDVIWPGSDSEETAEETERKRLRYEHHAKRYLRGHLPVLQSAALRGPLSGWVNPWRWVSKQDDWWQPGSEDMLFTREKVMQRAADHGLGYLGPTEALAWRKASAKAEAGALRTHPHRGRSVDRDTQPKIGNTLIVLNAAESPEDLPTKDESSTPNLEPTNPYLDQSMANHHSKTPYTKGNTRETTRGTKRPVDPHWLKGSYVSKRARWDGPAIATPTPHLEMGEKYRRRHQSFPKRGGSDNRTDTEPSRLSVSFADIPSARRRIDITLDPDSPDAASFGHGHTSATPALNSTFRRSSLEQSVGVLQQREEGIDELHNVSQESILTSSSRNRSRRKSQRRSRGFADGSVLDEEPDDLNAIIPRQNPSPSILSSGGGTQKGPLSSKSNELPKLPCKALEQKNDGNVHEVDEVDEYSFITEVAPSSRDLETFQYRKKRKRMDSEALKPNLNDPNLTANFQESPGMISKSGQNDEDEASDDQGSIEPENANETKTSSRIDQAPIVKDEAQERSNESDQSWDFIDDAIEQPSALLADSRALVENTSPKRSSHRDHNSPTPIPQTLKPSSKISSQRSKLSLRSSQPYQSQPFSDPRYPSPGPSAAKRRVGIFQGLNDGSTQSYNTSPPRPTLELPLEFLPQANPDNIQHEARSSEDIQDVMEDIHKTLSQNCPGFSSPASTQSDKHRGPEIGNLNEVGSLHEPPLGRPHAPRSIDANVSSQNSVVGEERTMGRAVSEIANVNELQRAKSTPHSQQNSQQKFPRAANAGKDPEPKTEAEPSITIHTSHVKDGSFEVINGQQGQARTLSSGVVRDVSIDEASITGALGEPHAAAGDIIKAVNNDLESSWEGCGPQSPWATENLELLSMNGHARINHGGEPNNGTSLIDGLDERLNSPESDPLSEEPDWHHVERPQTPPIDVITPFKDLMSPTPAPEAIASRLQGDGLPNTQSLVDAATNNPWTSSLRKPSSKKSKKRVSFSVQHSEEKENSQPDIFDNSNHSKRNPDSPPPEHGSYVDMYDDGTATVPKFIGHFVAAGQFKKILPQNQCSPMNGSPRLSAQAEAFIAADREASVEQLRSPFSPRSLSRKHKSRRDRVEEDPWLRDRSLGPLQASPKLPEKGNGNLMASFDMEDAIGDMSDFLGDWSVDAELKKAKGSKESKESEASGRRGSNGFRRRRLFGLV